MQRCFLILVCFIFFISPSFAQLQSPEQFLGYKIGSRFTPHWKIVDYFKQVAAAVPNMVKLQQYGTTYEGRPLMVTYVSLPDHITNLENIRQNNLRVAGIGNDNIKGNVENTPAIVWLSYNVHGNEASSSEVSMLTLYALVDPNNSRTKEWLRNTIVVIDPCINPDGRDRYVNWYNSVVGAHFNPNPDAREHDEPWPGGRTNHYNFDLNRDWAWQTQLETQQRLQLYNSWLPQVHVDFHEMGINSPYYFAPAAQPYHEVITPWQRKFQEMMGRNHARYFDANGWLYFTKEEYDLFYPSYGDTYPIYNGAIGMTYEQAGGGVAGLGIVTRSNDTLTLMDRVAHHFATSLSTIEVVSNNAKQLVTEFQNFYHTALAEGSGSYKSYVIKYSDFDAQRINALLQLLKKNNIRYGTGKVASVRGFNYDNGKEETIAVTPSDIIIPSLQPKSSLVKVLFEPNPRLVDSVTYDITAWSLPYVYGVKAFASRERLDASSAAPIPTVMNPATDTYGYVIPWNGMASVKLVTQLLLKGIKLRMSEEPFTINNQSFNRGSVIVVKTGNQYYANIWDTVRQLANANHVPLTPVNTGFVEKGPDFGSRNVHVINNRRIAVLTGDEVDANAAGEVWFLFEQTLNYPVNLINANDFSRTNWNDYDVVILPDGNYSFLNDKAAADTFKDWVRKGGHVIAMQNAVAQLSKLEWAVHAKKLEENTEANNPYEELKKYENRERDILSTTTPGSIFRVELDNTHPLAFGYPNYYYTLKQDDRIYHFFEEDGWNVGVIKKEKQLAGFVGSKLSTRLQDGLLFGVQDIGKGTVTYLADDVLFRSFWENGKLMFCNAVFLVGQ